MAQLEVIVTKSVMDELLKRAGRFRVLGIRQYIEGPTFPGSSSVTAECKPEFFEQLVLSTQATFERMGSNPAGFDYLSVNELVPDADHLAFRTRSIGFFTDRVDRMVL